MDKENNLFFSNQFALKYDELVGKQNWYGAEILLGMIFNYLKPKDKILDIGIGTGLSASGFHTLGLEVYGLDYSNEMLEVCRQKDISVDLKQFDLNDTPLPYPSNFFDHISANAILYFIDRLDNLFEEISRIIKKNGFTLLKKIEFIAENFQMEGNSVSFILYVTKANQ
ncbi:MAG: class I SAM-dependent methyltransferase [Desulfobacterium sp.]|nr:class I SAM-dependent methyltransferase [Desulfobacterium sp.]